MYTQSDWTHLGHCLRDCLGLSRCTAPSAHIRHRCGQGRGSGCLDLTECGGVGNDYSLYEAFLAIVQSLGGGLDFGDGARVDGGASALADGLARGGDGGLRGGIPTRAPHMTDSTQKRSWSWPATARSAEAQSAQLHFCSLERRLEATMNLLFSNHSFGSILTLAVALAEAPPVDTACAAALARASPFPLAVAMALACGVRVWRDRSFHRCKGCNIFS